MGYPGHVNGKHPHWRHLLCVIVRKPCVLFWTEWWCRLLWQLYLHIVPWNWPLEQSLPSQHGCSCPDRSLIVVSLFLLLLSCSWLFVFPCPYMSCFGFDSSIPEIPPLTRCLTLSLSLTQLSPASCSPLFPNWCSGWSDHFREVVQHGSTITSCYGFQEWCDTRFHKQVVTQHSCSFTVRSWNILHQLGSTVVEGGDFVFMYRVLTLALCLQLFHFSV